MGKQDILLHLATCVLSVMLGIGIGYVFFALPDSTSAVISLEPSIEHIDTVHASFEPEFLLPQQTEYEPVVEVFYELTPPHVPHIYIVMSKDGNVVVYYANPSGEPPNQIKTITNIAVAALPTEEQNRLAQGIFVYTEDDLFRILEDYGS